MGEAVAFIDGGARGNPGPAGIGVILQPAGGERVEISRPIGIRDNNYAEYAALLAALAYAVEHEYRSLRVYSDSEVVVRQINGHYRCDSPLLRRIYELCVARIASLEAFSIIHIRRELNGEADRLAHAAIERNRPCGRPAPILRPALVSSR